MYLHKPKYLGFCHACPAELPENPPDEDEVLCAACGTVNYRNTGPVANLLIPYQGGLIFQRRVITPKGKWSLPGGYIRREPWEIAAAREAKEEACVVVPDPTRTIIHHLTGSTPDGGHLVVFGILRTGALFRVDPFVASNESSDRRVVRPSDWASFKREVPFGLHIQAAEKFFASL